MSEIYITSDHHFFHGNIIKYCNRPFNSYQEMNEFMIKKWNEIVKKEDIVIHLGDFAFRNKANEIRSKLNGTIILIRGNHDLKISNEDFIIIEGNIVIKNLILSHRPLETIPEGFKNIHGHIHDKNSFHGINISVEKTDYKPLNIKTFL